MSALVGLYCFLIFAILEKKNQTITVHLPSVVVIMPAGVLPVSAFTINICVHARFYTHILLRLHLFFSLFQHFLWFPSILKENVNPNLSRQIQRRFSMESSF